MNNRLFQWSGDWQAGDPRDPAPRRSITTVIFDLDDTLYDEADYCRSGFRAIARFLHNAMTLPLWLDEQKLYETLWRQFESGDRTRVFNAAMDELNLPYDEEVIATMVRLYREHRPKISLPAETADVLDRLAKRYRLALLTDGFLPAQQYKVEALGLADRFEQIMYTHTLGRSYWKPHTKGFEMLCRKLGQSPQQCVYVADNAEKDFIAPNRLGMASIQIVRPNRVHTAPPAEPLAAPKAIIASLTQLHAALKRL